MTALSKRFGSFNIDEPRWDQSTFTGRLKHFANVTDPRLVVVPNKRYEEAKKLVQQYRIGSEPPGTTQDQLFYAQKLYQSAFHPDTGDLQNVVGRMSFQVPGGTILIGAMLAFYRSTGQVVFWQWANQSFNALVNYTNRNAKSPISTKRLAFAYVTATSSALAVAIGLKALMAGRAGNLAQRLVPLAAVFSANCVNIPLMRQTELEHGITLLDENGNETHGRSKVAAAKAITLVVISRNVIAAPSMIGVPVIMEQLEKYAWFQARRNALNTPFQALLTAAFLVFTVPLGCALFPQRNYISSKTLEKYEKRAYDEIKADAEASGQKMPEYLYFNKGL